MSTKIEYLNPTDWSLHVVDVDNDAVGEDWIKVPEGAEWAKLWADGCKYKSVIEFYRGYNEFFSETRQEWLRGNDQSTNKLGQPATIVWDRRHSQPEELPFVDDDPKTAWDKQEGGSHYKNLKIQPMQYALDNKLDYAQANVVKYVTRHASKNGKEDLLKAIHNIELMIEYYYGDKEQSQ